MSDLLCNPPYTVIDYDSRNDKVQGAVFLKFGKGNLFKIKPIRFSRAQDIGDDLRF